MNLKIAHFERWQQLFHQTVEDHFTGDLALEIHTRASTIAKVWQHKLGLT